MNAKAVVFRSGEGFYPATDMDKEKLKGILAGTSAVMTFKKMRNPRQHRLYWAIVQGVYDNLTEVYKGRYLTVTDFHEELKYLCGATKVMRTIEGKEFVVVRSIAFGSMKQDDFKAYLDKALDAIREYFLPNVDEMDEVNKWIAEKV